MVEGPNSRAHKLACPSRGHRVTVMLPCVLGGLGMSSRLGTPHVGAKKKNYNIRFSDRSMLKHELAAKCLISDTGNAHG